MPNYRMPPGNPRAPGPEDGMGTISRSFNDRRLGDAYELSEPTGSAGRMGPSYSVSPTIVRQPQSSLGDLAGARVPSAPGLRFQSKFAKGGSAKAKPKVKKMAKGGSTASKRADGCATKGKTKGRMV